ncbi:MAG: GMC family oxidoreductase [Flavobacteriaceae bacterium]
MPEAETFDYVIVGAGAAGSVLAERLSADGGRTVCILEAGPPDTNPWLHIPAGYVKTLVDPRVLWQFATEPSPGSGGRAVYIPQGRVYGGSSSLNGLVYNRGQAADFDHWAQLGNSGWAYEDLLPYFRRSEERIGKGDDRYRGRSGPLKITDPGWSHPLTEAFIDGVAATGVPRGNDYNGESQAGTGYYQRMIHRGWRISAARAFLHPALRRRNVEIRSGAQAASILLEDGRAVGVRYFTGGDKASMREVRCRREVVVSAGTVNSAKLLQLSGIGPGGLLGEHGIEVRCELPVGENFRDHYFVRLAARLKPGTISLNQMAKGWRLGREVFRWALGRPSILALSPSIVYVFWKSDPALEAPDLQFVCTPGSYKPGQVYVLDDFPAITCGFTQQRPESVGHVRIRSADPLEKPELQPNYLADAGDREVVLRAMRMTRGYLRSASLAPYYEREEVPGEGVRGDDELMEFARRTGNTGYHLIGTCRMGPRGRRDAVVDPELRVQGVGGLRVVDASIMPRMVSANTYASTLMIAEKGADMILAAERGASRA